MPHVSLGPPREAEGEPLEAHQMIQVGMTLTTHPMTQEKAQRGLVRELGHQEMGETQTGTVIDGMACGHSSRRTPR